MARKSLKVITTLLVLALVSTLVILSLLGGVDSYQPTTDDPRIVYQEACARCHGETGLGVKPGGPRLAGKDTPRKEIGRQITQGHGRMPRFPNIQGRALANLMDYVEAMAAPSDAPASDPGEMR